MNEHIFLKRVVLSPAQRKYLRGLFKRGISDANFNALVKALVESAETQQVVDVDAPCDPRAAQRLEEVKAQARKLARCIDALGPNERTLLNQLAGGTLPYVDDISQGADQLACDLSVSRGRPYSMKYISALGSLAQRFETIFGGQYRISADESAIFVRLTDFFLRDMLGANADAKRECARLIAFRARYRING